VAFLGESFDTAIRDIIKDTDRFLIQKSPIFSKLKGMRELRGGILLYAA